MHPGRNLLPVLTMLFCVSCAPFNAETAAELTVDDCLLLAEEARAQQAWPQAAGYYLDAALLGDTVDNARRATEFAADFGYSAMALQAAQRWLELAPDDPVAHGHAGSVRLRRHDVAAAFEHFRQQLGASPADEAYVELESKLAGEPPAAVTDLFKRFIRLDPDSPGLQRALLRAAAQADDYELALDIAARMIRSAPDALEPRVVTAQALMALGRERESLELIESLRSDPPILGVELTYVRLLAAGGRRSDAYRELANLANEYGAQTDFIRLFALISLSAEELDIAERNFERLMSAGQNIYENLYYLGRIAVLRENYRQGIQYFARVGAGDYLVPAQLAAALAYQLLGQTADGVEHLQAFQLNYPRRALEVEPTRVRLLFESGQTGQALAAYAVLLARQPDSVELMIEYGVLLDLAGETGEAISVMQRAVRIVPQDANALNSLGYTLANNNRRLHEAYDLIRRALELEPDSGPVIDSMGWVLYRLGRNDEALSYLQRAHRIIDDPEVTAHLAEVLWVTGAAEAARELLENSLLEYPGDPLLTDTLAKIG